MPFRIVMFFMTLRDIVLYVTNSSEFTQESMAEESKNWKMFATMLKKQFKSVAGNSIGFSFLFFVCFRTFRKNLLLSHTCHRSSVYQWMGRKCNDIFIMWTIQYTTHRAMKSMCQRQNIWRFTTILLFISFEFKLLHWDFTTILPE